MLSSFALIFPLIIAGIMNGSFVVPVKYTRQLSNEKIWLYHSVIGVVFIPWLILFVLFPSTVHNYTLLTCSSWSLLIMGGLMFGVGQICFAYAIKFLGIALSFTINLGIGVTIGSLFVILYKSALFSEQGYFAIAAIGLIVCSLIIYYFSAKDKPASMTNQLSAHSHYVAGWILAVVAGLISGLQNIVFYLVAFGMNTPSTNSFWVWPVFLSAAFLPMFCGFLYQTQRSMVPTDRMNYPALTLRNIGLVIAMGLLFTGSLAVYSLGMDHLTSQQQIIGWPAFMLSIILTSQLWGWFNKEAVQLSRATKAGKLISVVLLVIAIVLLSIKT